MKKRLWILLSVMLAVFSGCQRPFSASGFLGGKLTHCSELYRMV